MSDILGMMKRVSSPKLTIILSMTTLSVFWASSFWSAGALAQDSSAYKLSPCYQEFVKVYQDTVENRLNHLKFRQSLALETGIILNQPPSSDWGEEEKSVVNAADLRPSYDPSKINNEKYLNAFSYIHHKVIEDYPEMSPYQTREYVRTGFQEGKFCSKFLFFKFRSSRRKVAKWIKDRIEDDLESSAISFAKVSDSELDKGELLNAKERPTKLETHSAPRVEGN